MVKILHITYISQRGETKFFRSPEKLLEYQLENSTEEEKTRLLNEAEFSRFAERVYEKYLDIPEFLVTGLSLVLSGIDNSSSYIYSEQLTKILQDPSTTAILIINDLLNIRQCSLSWNKKYILITRAKKRDSPAESA